MDFHSEMILEQYDENLASYKLLKDIVEEKLKYIVRNELGLYVNSIESRIKTRESLIGKLELKGFKYNSIFDITDILGGRIITFYNDDVDKVAAKIKSEFKIDWENSIDKRKNFKIDQFGYMSLHFICLLPKEMYYDENHPELNEIKFEIQLRTNLQHTWAAIYHDTGYKNDIEVPTEMLRALNRLAGLLELADDEFSKIKNRLEEYHRKVKAIVASGKFDEVELNGDTFKEYIASGAFDDLLNRIKSINNMEVEEVNPTTYFYTFIKLFGFTTLGDLDNFRKEYEELAYQFAIYQVSGTDLDIISSTMPLFCLCCAFAMKKKYGEVGIKLILDYVYGERKNNERQAKRIIEMGKKMGLVD